MLTFDPFRCRGRPRGTLAMPGTAAWQPALGVESRWAAVFLPQVKFKVLVQLWAGASVPSTLREGPAELGRAGGEVGHMHFRLV